MKKSNRSSTKMTNMPNNTMKHIQAKLSPSNQIRLKQVSKQTRNKHNTNVLKQKIRNKYPEPEKALIKYWIMIDSANKYEGEQKVKELLRYMENGLLTLNMRKVYFSHMVYLGRMNNPELGPQVSILQWLIRLAGIKKMYVDDTVFNLLKRFVKVNKEIGIDGTALHDICELGYTPRMNDERIYNLIKLIVEKDPHLVNVKNQRGETPMIIAFMNRNRIHITLLERIVKLYMKHNAKVNGDIVDAAISRACGSSINHIDPGHTIIKSIVKF